MQIDLLVDAARLAAILSGDVNILAAGRSDEHVITVVSLHHSVSSFQTTNWLLQTEMVVVLITT